MVVAHYSGMTVAQMSDLRVPHGRGRGVVPCGQEPSGGPRSERNAVEGIAHLFKGPTGIAVSDDPIAASKVAVAYAKDNDKLVILGGAVGATALDVTGIKALASLPSLDELRGRSWAACGARDQDRRHRSSAAGQLARVIGAYSTKDAA